MFQLVIFSSPVKRYDKVVYGKLFSGTSLPDIKNKAKKEYQDLLYLELWDKDDGPGQDFRNREGWEISVDDNNYTGWLYDRAKYTFSTQYLEMPDQFLEQSPTPLGQISLVSGWVPIKFYDLKDDFLINRFLYDSIMLCPDQDWESINELEEELPI